MAALCRALCGVSGFSAIGLGAYGAHGVDMSDYQKKVWERATTYHLAHTVAATAALGLPQRGSGRAATACTLASASFLGGNALFSGSLYTFVLTGESAWAKVAPYGGGCLMLGWLAISASSVL
ncbi:hypothetical protein T492DRAFT_937637 [Pavlovales sp. CCMP2436]|nr:hypothetical protein T492DRAFT_937637 [Pavlovales sp. CCMP2436]